MVGGPPCPVSSSTSDPPEKASATQEVSRPRAEG